MPIGYGAGLGGGASKRKLSPVNSFKDIAKAQAPMKKGLASYELGGAAGPSMARGPQQPGGFGPGPGIRNNIDPALAKGLPGGATGAATGTGYTAPVTATAPTKTPYSEARVGETPGAFGAPAGGFPQRSPWFGAGGQLPPEPGQEMQAFQPEAGLGAGETGERLEAGGVGRDRTVEDAMATGGLGDLPAQEYDPMRGEYQPSGVREGGAAGLTPEERRGEIDVGTPGTAGETVGEINEDERQFNELIDQLDVSQEEAQRKLDAAFAQAQRRNAEVNAAMGTSVSGGYAGTTAASTLGYLQQMQDMMADFQTRKTNLQLQWLDKKTSRDFQREMAERSEKQSYIQSLLDSNQEIPEGMWDEAGIGPEQKADMLAGGGAGGPEGTTGEPGALKNEAGDLLMGAGGLGTSGSMQSNPWEEDGESHQWYARSVGREGEKEYYRTDENGNEVAFEPGVDGGRWPGDVSLLANFGVGQVSADYVTENYGQGSGYYALDPAGHDEYTLSSHEPEVWKHPDSGYPTTMEAGKTFLERMANRLGHEDHASMFGAGVGNEWKSNGHYQGDNMALRALVELSQFTSLYRHQNDGMAPSDNEIFEHLRKAGNLPRDTPGNNPFPEEEA